MVPVKAATGCLEIGIIARSCCLRRADGTDRLTTLSRKTRREEDHARGVGARIPALMVHVPHGVSLVAGALKLHGLRPTGLGGGDGAAGAGAIRARWTAWRAGVGGRPLARPARYPLPSSNVITT